MTVGRRVARGRERGGLNTGSKRSYGGCGLLFAVLVFSFQFPVSSFQFLVGGLNLRFEPSRRATDAPAEN